MDHGESKNLISSVIVKDRRKSWEIESVPYVVQVIFCYCYGLSTIGANNRTLMNNNYIIFVIGSFSLRLNIFLWSFFTEIFLLVKYFPYMCDEFFCACLDFPRSLRANAEEKGIDQRGMGGG